MRGRRRRPSPSSSSSSSSSVCQQQGRMALRKQIMKDVGESGSQQSDDDTQDDGAPDDRDDKDELSTSLLPPISLRERRKRERESKPKPKEMTEEEMMDMALRLSEQEASITALRLQKEEEAVMKAIQESMVSQTQPCAPLRSQSLLSDAEASLKLCSRRKLSYSNRKQPSEEGCSSEMDPNGESNGPEDESQRSKKRRKREGSPLLIMPDLSQTQKISQDSQSTSEPLNLQLDSPQSCDSTQIEDCKSPVFPLTGCRAEVQVPGLKENLLDSCRTSGFELCSQDSSHISQKSLPAQSKSPTFSKSPQNCRDTLRSRSPVFSETEQGDDSDTQLSADELKSPVFGRTTQQGKSPKACRPHIFNSGFTSSSQESLSSSMKSASCPPQSPVFPKSPAFHESVPPPERCKSPVFSKTDEQTEQSYVCSRSPVFNRIEKPSKSPVSVQTRSESPAEIRDCFQSLKEDQTSENPDIRCNTTVVTDELEEELIELSKGCNPAEMELSSDMKLLWSDDDEDNVTPAASPSPVFPQERSVHQTSSQTASQNHISAASPGTNRPNCSQQISPSEPDAQPIRNQGSVSRLSAPPAEPAAAATVHYYWGVPFCPRGLDPDSYTEVILAQMEVYKKSLRTAQRSLLRKAEWGEAVLPQEEKSPLPESQSPESSEQDAPRSRGLRLRGKRLNEDDDSAVEGKEEEEKMDGEEEQKKDEGGGGGGGGGEPVDLDDCEVCPETQLSNNDDDDQTQVLMMDADAGAELDPKSPEPVDVDMILRDDSPAGDERAEEVEEEMELEADAPVDSEMKGISSVGDSVGGHNVREDEAEEDHGDAGVEEMNSCRLQRSASPELEPDVIPPSSETNVDCPICLGSFPVSQIEMHAAYCDGEVSVVHERRPKADCYQVKTRRKRTRRTEMREEEEDTNEPSNSGKNQEKCYICQKAVPLRDYSRHTELCIQRQEAKRAGKGNLLSALEQTDSRDSDAGASGSKPQTGEVIELLDDDDDDDDDDGENNAVSALRISNSPIRAFTPISEATDCLIDFKNQRRVKKPSQRRR
ncbi:BRCA1-A complex subunit RAP80 isoform X2 [Cheilinus undulatus]|uniref:BRCA1-A complex subunit RAP80 isoform X2 n=1 Tax=Cheilinus undulatus TaxID=241271 RepID=UPI001BD63488|nr:BRCA1-A complex subunit RAP80 isoform X2 [Cheilinus undulatus]